MAVSGKKVSLLMIGGFVLFVGGALLIIKFHKGREYNREITIKAQMQKVQLKKIQKYLKEKKKDFGTFKSEDLSDLCDGYEFIYFPGNIKDMRKPLIMSRKEIVLKFKGFDGQLNDVYTGLGFYVLFGDTFEVKTYPADKLKELINLELDEQNFLMISNRYIKGTSPKAFLLKKQKSKN